MDTWLSRIADITGSEVLKSSGKAQTMPAKGSKKDESAKKKGKFTMRKK